MGRKKIQISRITDERNRQVTFNKRKFGVMKKAYELSVLCDCEIALIIFSSSNKLYQYASTDMDKVLLKYTEYNEPHESLTNKNIIEALNKKEHKNGNCSPDSPDPEPDYTLTPRTEAKYSKIDEEFQMMMQRNHMNGNRQSSMGQNYSMPVSVPVNSSYGDSTSGLMQPSPQMTHSSLSPRPSSSGTDPGGLLDMSNGYAGPPSPLPLVGSPGLQGHHSGKSKQNSPGSRPNLRVVIPQASATSASAVSLSNDEEHHVRNSWQQQQQQHIRSGVSSLNTPVVTLPSPSGVSGLSNYPSTLSSSFVGTQEFTLNPDLNLTNLSGPHTWNLAPLTNAVQHNIHPSTLSHLNPSPPPSSSSSPLTVRIKSEPISPPRDGSTSQLPRPNSTGRLSPSGHLTPNSGQVTPNNHNHPSPGESLASHSSDYDNMQPMSKRSRISDGWAT